MTRTARMAVVGVAAATVAGCGSSGSNTVPKAQLIARADAICRKYASQLPPQPKFNPATATPAQLRSGAPYLRKVAAFVAAEVAQVSRLGRPDKDAALFDQVMAEGRTTAADLQIAAAAAARGDKKAFLAAVNRLQRSPSHGRQFGFRVCDSQ